MRQEFNRPHERYPFEIINGNRRFETVDRDLRERIERALGKWLTGLVPSTTLPGGPVHAHL